MKVAVWRYSMSLQTDADSTVGGGRITSSVIDALLRAGHSVSVVSKASAASQQWLIERGVGYEPTIDSLAAFDAAFVLTGSSNVRFGDGVVRTYAMLSTMQSGAPAAYLQWDAALPFMFRPENVGLFLEKGGRGWPSVCHLKWHLVTQVAEQYVRAAKGKSNWYQAPFEVVPCLFELTEWERPQKEVLAPTVNAVGYFGSDRPGRIVELKRWFKRPGAPPLHIYGRWSQASKAKLAANNVVFFEPVPEGDVHERLASFAMTFYMADAAYVRQDFVAQRFFENAVAGVPTYYSDKVQPSVARVAAPFVVRDPALLPSVFESVCSLGGDERSALVAFHRERVGQLVLENEHRDIHSALQEVLG